MQRPEPLILLILDGFGVTTETTGNPVATARADTLAMLEREFPFVSLQASGIAVGLPWGVPGNSEVGHLTIGAGRAIHHHLPRIILSIYDDSFFSNPAFMRAAAHVKTHGGHLHIAGLVSSGSVHSYVDHLYALLDFTKRQELKEVFVHIFTDGKDAPADEAENYVRALEERMQKEWPHAKIASITGRFYALDRDQHWDRTEKAFTLLTKGEGARVTSAEEYLRESYTREISDEFIEPAVVVNPAGDPLVLIQENDALIFSDFREDSMRQLARAFAEEKFTPFPRELPANLFVVTMTEYQQGLKAEAAFPPLAINWPLARIIGDAGMRHLHIAETQKYAHVTYFLNGGTETLFQGEERIFVSSDAVTHFDEHPEMKTQEITAHILEKFGTYDVIIANFANADMVGHSGNFDAAVRAVEVIDEALALLTSAIIERGGVLLVTADHGNIELKRHILSGERVTQHSTNPVPLFLVGAPYRRAVPRSMREIHDIKSRAAGLLTDVAPTIIELLDLHQPAEMTGKSLVNTLRES